MVAIDVTHMCRPVIEPWLERRAAVVNPVLKGKLWPQLLRIVEALEGTGLQLLPIRHLS